MRKTLGPAQQDYIALARRQKAQRQTERLLCQRWWLVTVYGAA